MTARKIADQLLASQSAEDLQMLISEWKRLRRRFIQFGINGQVVPVMRKWAISQAQIHLKNMSQSS